jgi:hypothetical protein
MKEEFEKEKEGFDKEPEFGIQPLKLTNKKKYRASGKYSKSNSKSVKSKKKIDRKLKRELLRNYGFSIDN